MSDVVHLHEKRARSFNITICDDPNCRAVHIQLIDEREHCFAGMTINADNVDEVIDGLRHMAEQVRAKCPAPANASRLTFEEMDAPFPGQRLWGCRWRQWSFVIEWQPSLNYSASWKTAIALVPASANRIEPDGGFLTLAEAIVACEAKAAELVAGDEKQPRVP